MGAFMAIDSVECSVHLVGMTEEGRLDTMATFKTDNTYKRHDLKNILRPVSVGIMGRFFVVLASAVNDSAYVALLDEHFNEVARRSFSSPMYAMLFEYGHMFVVGRNPSGYDINILKLHGGPEAFAKGDIDAFAKGDMLTHHYRVAKQSEKIKQSDPVGIGLTATAIAVVFLALVFIALIISGTGKLMAGMDDKKKDDKKKKGGAAVAAAASAADKEGEVYAAIATAIHLFNNELHDEEETVLTIQKVEREWTPWNAKYYNMNQYFNNRR
jgi:sodium pump decarboxylase gamma subunit